MPKFKIVADYKLSGDQPRAVSTLTAGVKKCKKNQVLMGVTGSGKTFSMANIIENVGKPALIMVHNKTLAAQIYEEMKSYLPNNAVEYFVSYYDYYQPEAYIPRSDTYIEKDAAINEHIDLMRHSATRSLIERTDTVVVSSVSCIYGLGSPVNYAEMTIGAKKGDTISLEALIKRLIELQYERNQLEFSRGKFRVQGDSIDIFPSFSSKVAIRIVFFGNEVEEIKEFDPITGHNRRDLNSITLYANSHFVTPKNIIANVIDNIKYDLKQRLDWFYKENKLVEAQRLEQRTNLDIEMLQQTGTCKGIENYSRYLNGNNPGQPPPTLFSYLPNDALLFIDESHVTVPQIRAMYNGDRARKMNLVEYGFRLPAALDNRPLKFDEWDKMRPDTIFVSATPAMFELELTSGEVVEQIIRPTGLIDPICEVRPATNQVDDVIHEIKQTTKQGFRVLVTTLTKKMAEDLTDYLKQNLIKVSYLHSDVDTLERIKIIQQLRSKFIDVIVGINLLREGLDIPECGMVAILDADKEGFLRSETSLIQTIGRAARNANGRVLLYANKMTKSITKALDETNRRRKIQSDYNKEHNIIPKTIFKSLKDEFYGIGNQEENIEQDLLKLSHENIVAEIANMRKKMIKSANDLDFEKAAEIRDIINRYEQQLKK